MTDYKYAITIRIDPTGEAVDYWCDHNDRGVYLPHEAWEALIRHARQDWQERKQAQDAVDALRAARGGRG